VPQQEWVETTLKTLEAEFPTWHLVNSFDVFHLAGVSSSEKKRGPGMAAALTKLAKTFEVNEADLRSQFVSVLPTAQALQKQTGMDNRCAWAEALARLQARSDMRAKYPSAALKKAGSHVTFKV